MTRSSTSPLRHRDFSLYLGSMFATGLAVQMSQVAIGWQVFHINHRPLDLGLVGLSEFVPLPLLALPAGALADRLPRRTTFAVAVGLDAAVAAGLLALTVSGPTAVWPFFVLALGTGVASALGAPPSRALTPSLVPAEILTRAMAVRSVAFEISAIAGPALGGVLFYLRPELVYEVSTALSAGSLLCVLAIRSGREPASGEAPTLDSVFDGLRLIRRTPVMLGAIRSTSSPCSSAAPWRSSRCMPATSSMSGRSGWAFSAAPRRSGRSSPRCSSRADRSAGSPGASSSWSSPRSVCA